ncbi:GNAT family N-acetyltransferase [Arsenicicoccus dermatophilus]|uniref:GNAT family N-acetyltransferase n=1 Tax=Arsenicicoccus dermatophilus TaxID=1076331 RepID=UPI0039176265
MLLARRACSRAWWQTPVMAEDTVVTRNDHLHRYEVRRDGELAGFADAHLDGEVLVVPHTEVDPAFGGMGLGSALVRGMLDDVRERGLRVEPACSFVASWLDKHPEYADLRA